MMSLTVVIQFSLAFLLLTLAGLLLQSFARASKGDPGFQSDHVVSMRISLPSTMYKDAHQVQDFYDRLLANLSGLPGVQNTGVLSDLPMSSTSNRLVTAENNPTVTQKVDTVFAGGNALQTLHVALISGRLLGPDDHLKDSHVVVISSSLAKTLWPGADPIGRRMTFGGDSPWLTVVGVVGDIKARLTSDAPRPLVFTVPEEWVRDMVVLVAEKNSIDLSQGMREQLARIDPSLPAQNVETLDRVLDDSLGQEHFRTTLLMCFAAAALSLAMLGIGAS